MLPGGHESCSPELEVQKQHKEGTGVASWSPSALGVSPPSADLREAEWGTQAAAAVMSMVGLGIEEYPWCRQD